MTPKCKDCGQQHDRFLDGVVCDLAHYGPDGTVRRLSRFMPGDAAAALVAEARVASR